MHVIIQPRIKIKENENKSKIPRRLAAVPFHTPWDLNMWSPVSWPYIHVRIRMGIFVRLYFKKKLIHCKKIRLINLSIGWGM